ncbi:MAG: ABC transporter permease subunit [Polyangiaceae bacterium]
MSAVDKRRAADRVFTAACKVSFALALSPLALVLVAAARRVRLDGAIARDVANAFAGSIYLVGLAAAGAVPLGVFAGVCAAELASPRSARVMNLFTDVLAGIPPIVIGVFVNVLFVLPMGGFSLFAGAVALGIVLAPPIARATEAILALSTQPIKEVGLSLGLRRYRVIVLLMLRSAMPRISGVVLASIARGLGESAPLLFTSASARSVSASPAQPVPTLSVQIFHWAQQPGDGPRARAALATLFLVSAVAVLAALARRTRSEPR